MSEPAIIRIKGLWYEVTRMQESNRESISLDYTGENVLRGKTCKGFCGTFRHSLTPCPAPLAMTLGEQLLAAVPEHLRDRVIRLGATKSGEYELNPRMLKDADSGQYPSVILSPPAPKSDREVLEAMVEQVKGFKGEFGAAFRRLASFLDAKQHLETTKPGPA